MEQKIICQRCDRGQEATHLAYSNILQVAVCALCVLDALALPYDREDAVSVRPLFEAERQQTARSKQPDSELPAASCNLPAVPIH